MNNRSMDVEPSWSKRVILQFGLAVWALVTFLLAVTTVLLYWQVVDLGARTPDRTQPTAVTLNTASPGLPSASPEGNRSQAEQRNIEIYGYDPRTGNVMPRTVTIEGSTVTEMNCRKALNALLEPFPEDSPIRSPFPPGTRVRGFYLLGKEEIVIDFSGDVTRIGPYAGGCALWESAMVHCLALTLGSPKLRGNDETTVRRVRVLVEGASPGNEFPAHLDLSEAIDVEAMTTASDTSP
ncbi:MAG TPA: GerMN domain-containing protein [Candidatus Hydrogenedentes bacterium]|nr:GerMN domain-containing protein [Candidatus Hydrogenedentota bacterium]